MQSKAKNLIDRISQDEVKKEEAKNAQRSLNMLRESFIADKKQNVKERKVVAKNIDVQEGEEVLVKTLNQNGKVLRIIPETNSVQVQAGILKLVVSMDDIVKIEKKKVNKFRSFASLKSSQVRGEIDLRGKNADLRKKIQEFLKTSKYVTEFKDANQNEGGIGCTVATLK